MDEKMMQESLKQFFQMASQDLELQERLKAANDREAYIRLVVELSKEKGYSFTRDQVVTALDTATAEAAKNLMLQDQLSEKELDVVAGGSELCTTTLPTPPPSPPPGAPPKTQLKCEFGEIISDIFD